MARTKKKAKADTSGRKIIARNKRAFRDYFITDRYEAGLVLLGSEVKSLRDGRANIGDAYAEIKGGEVFLVSSHITEYPQATHENHEPRRTRKLLLNRSEIKKLMIKLLERGFTLVPLDLYFYKGRAKIELGLAKGKHQYDKRHAMRDRDQQRDEEVAERRRR